MVIKQQVAACVERGGRTSNYGAVFIGLRRREWLNTAITQRPRLEYEVQSKMLLLYRLLLTKGR